MPTLSDTFAPHDEQRAVHGSDARFRVVAAGRRSGKTILAAVATVRRALEGDSSWNGYWVGAEHHHSLTAFELIDAAVPDRLVTRRKESPPRVIELNDGPEISFHTAGGGALVSEGLDWAVCDEAAKAFPERTWTQELRPALSDRNGAAMFISTPDGRGWFHDRWQRGRSPEYSEWASWRWSSYANPYVDDAEIDAARDDIPDRVFRQEYRAEFLDETGGVFTELDRRLFTADYELPLAADDAVAPYSIGVDLARHEDYRVIVVVDAAGHVCYFGRDRGESWPAIQRAVEDVAATYPGVVSVDASRDNKLVADLEAAGLRVEPVTFGGGTKQELMENLIATVESGELSAPDISALRSEMEVFEYDVTRAGNVRYTAPEGFYDDAIDALALAVDGMGAVAGAATATVNKNSDDKHDGEGIMGAIDAHARRNTGNKWK
jgi:hypothetical protein